MSKSDKDLIAMKCLHCAVSELLVARRIAGTADDAEQTVTYLAEVIGEIAAGAPNQEYVEALLNLSDAVARLRTKMAFQHQAGAGAATVGPSGKAN